MFLLEVQQGTVPRRSEKGNGSLGESRRDTDVQPFALLSRSNHAAAARSSLSAPRATILRASSGNGRCSALASFHGAGMQTSHSSGVRQDDRGFGFDLVPRSPLNSVQSPPKANRGRSSLSANQTTSFFLVSGFGSGAYSAKLFSHASAGTCGRSQAPGAGQRQNAERGRGKPRTDPRRECREHRDAD